MSQRKRGTPRPYLGHAMTKYDQSAVASLISYACLPFGVAKRSIKSESELWAFTGAVFDLEPVGGETFTAAVRRITGCIRAMSPLTREMHRAAAATKFEAEGLPIPRDRVKPRIVASRRKPPAPGPGGKASKSKREDFYKSWEWRTLRMTVLKKHGPRCMCCGSTPDQTALHGAPVRIVVDHIKPLYTHWHMRLDADNLQVLCDECNMGKGAWDTTDWRADDTVFEDAPLSPIEHQLGERFRVIEGGAA